MTKLVVSFRLLTAISPTFRFSTWPSAPGLRYSSSTLRRDSNDPEIEKLVGRPFDRSYSMTPVLIESVTRASFFAFPVSDPVNVIDALFASSALQVQESFPPASRTPAGLRSATASAASTSHCPPDR